MTWGLGVTETASPSSCTIRSSLLLLVTRSQLRDLEYCGRWYHHQGRAISLVPNPRLSLSCSVFSQTASLHLQYFVFSPGGANDLFARALEWLTVEGGGGGKRCFFFSPLTPPSFFRESEMNRYQILTCSK